MNTFLLIGILLTPQGQYLDHYYKPVTEKECRKQETANGYADKITVDGKDYLRIMSCYDMGKPV